ncbi:MAG: hypothetical protein IPK93_03630 [Solirubrobacterales bacterium]|nr:hypothetical protein [Solirubrobacterales bacterium]
MSKPPETIRSSTPPTGISGGRFYEADLSVFHQMFFDWLFEQVTELEVDVVLMAGDIFDRAVLRYEPSRC